MNTTSENSGQKFPFSSGHNVMNNRTIYVTLAVSTAIGFLFTLAKHQFVQGLNPFDQLGHDVLTSSVPALGAFVVVKLTSVFLSWRGVAVVYIALLVLVTMLQAVGGMIPGT